MMNNTTDSSISTSNQGSFNPPQTISHKQHRKKRSKLIRLGNVGLASTPTTTPSSSYDFSKPKPPWKKPQFDAPKITRPCSECGKRFWSWKALFGHMRCHPERQWRGINPPPNFQRAPVSPLASYFTEEDHEVATCLLMLANGSPCVKFDEGNAHENVEYLVAEPSGVGEVDGIGSSCRFECSSCKKVFGSHQALGGHRASHKNVKGCFAIARTDNDGDEHHQCCDHNHRNDEGDEAKIMMDLGHQCSICQRLFSSGQALGGHKRCHWEKGEASSRDGLFDLNLPAPIETDEGTSPTNLALDLRLGI